MRQHIRAGVLAASIGVGLSGLAYADIQAIMMPNSSANVVVTFDPETGAVMDAMFIDLNPLDAGTPQHAITVGDEIWLTDQTRDRIDRFSLDGQTHLGVIGGQVPGGGLDNIRGQAWDGANTVYVANAGTNNDAPGTAIVMIDVSTNSVVGNFTLPDNDSPWFPVVDGGSLYVSTISNHRIQEFDLLGNHLNLIYQGDPVGNMRFIQQFHLNNAGNFFAAGFSSAGGGTAGLYEISLAGVELLQVPESGVRGVWELGNGNLLWSNGSGAHVYDFNTGTSTTVYSGVGRKFGALISTPATCPGDLTGSGSVGVPDLLELLACWGPVAPGCEEADLTGSGTVGVPDLLELLANWGPCP